MKGNGENAPNQILDETVAHFGSSIDRMEIGQDDHIHLLMSAPPKLSVTDTARRPYAEAKDIDDQSLKVVKANDNEDF